MSIILKNSWDIPTTRWGSTTDVQYAVKVNAEKIYGINPKLTASILPLFWKLPLIDYNIRKQNQYTNYGTYAKSQGLNFDGSDYINTPHSSFLNVTDYLTVIARVYIDAARLNGKTGVIVAKGDWSSLGKGYTFGYNDSAGQKAIVALVAISSLNSIQMEYGNVTQGWHNLGFVFDKDLSLPSRLRLYVDGQEVGTQTAQGSCPTIGINSLPVRIGRDSGTNNFYFDSIIGYVNLFYEAFTPEQMLKFNELPYGLYQKAIKPTYFFLTTPVVGWTGKINSITNPAKINSVAVADIGKVMGQ